jgi:hypothetical protein
MRRREEALEAPYMAHSRLHQPASRLLCMSFPPAPWRGGRLAQRGTGVGSVAPARAQGMREGMRSWLWWIMVGSKHRSSGDELISAAGSSPSRGAPLMHLGLGCSEVISLFALIRDYSPGSSKPRGGRGKSWPGHGERTLLERRQVWSRGDSFTPFGPPEVVSINRTFGHHSIVIHKPYGPLWFPGCSCAVFVGTTNTTGVELCSPSSDEQHHLS